MEYSDELNKLINKTINYDNILTIVYSSTGGMGGGIRKNILDLESKTMTIENKDWYNSPLNATEYSVSADDIEQILSYIDKYNFPAWHILEIDPFFISMDAGDTTLTFETIYENKKDYYTINFNDNMPTDARRYFNEFIDIFFDLAKDENIIREYIKNEEVGSEDE
mgnify:CR=1 FL=1